MLELPNFDKIFQVDCDSSVNVIGAILSQQGRSIVYFNENLNDAREIYSVYDQEFYAIIQALKNWRHYLLLKEFVLYTDHQSQQYLNNQDKLNKRHMCWVKFMYIYTFMLKIGVEIKTKL